MIFVTLGSQKFQFDRLLKQIDVLIDNNVIEDEVFAQIGYSTYIPKNFKYSKFLNRDDFSKYMLNSYKVITHAGTGAIIGALKADNIVIAVPRLSEYGEHVDNHQVQIIEQFKEMNLIEACFNVENLEEAYLKSNSKTYNKYVSNTDTIINDINKFISDI